MTPRPASPDSSAKSPKPTTTTPADLKKSGAYFECANEAEPKDRSASMGKVPNANANIIINPEAKEPLPSAPTCMDWVKPHGRKKVIAPSKSGVSEWLAELMALA